jgi:hypothetical protein
MAALEREESSRKRGKRIVITALGSTGRISKKLIYL